MNEADFWALLPFLIILVAVAHREISRYRQGRQAQDSANAGQGAASPGGPERGEAAPAAEQQSAAPLVPAEWLRRVNDEPDRRPHLLVVGGSGSGKTTLVEAVLRNRPGKIVIITPKVDDWWGGLPFISIDPDFGFTSIAAALNGVYQELLRRNTARDDRAWLSVVIDDYPWIADECEIAAKILTIVGNMGRSVRVRLIVMAQSKGVKALKLEGSGDLRSNFSFIELELDEDTEARTGVIYRWGQAPRPISLQGLTQWKAAPIDGSRWWEPPAVEPEEGGAVLVTPEEHTLIRALLKQYSPSDAAKQLPGYRPKDYGKFKAKVDYVRKQLSQIGGN